MIVHLVVSTHTIQQNMPIYERMIDVIHAQGGSLARNWIQPAYHHPERLSDDLRRVEIVEQVEDAILRSDVVIADVSDRGTAGVGPQIAWALQNGKPVLALQRSGTADGILVGVIINPQYTFVRTDEYEATIGSFLEGIE